MTPTEIKAKEKAKEVLGIFSSLMINGGVCDVKSEYKRLAILHCEGVIEALNSIKGMSKIHKVKLWKLVKTNIENE